MATFTETQVLRGRPRAVLYLQSAAVLLVLLWVASGRSPIPLPGGKPADLFVLVLILSAFLLFILPLLLTMLKLEVKVEGSGISIHFHPLKRRTISLAEVARCGEVTFRPLRDCGGTGARWGYKGGWSFTLVGNRGVEVETRDGKIVLIGSQRPSELAQAIRAGMGR